MKPGDTLRNGAVCVAFESNIVLAVRTDGSDYDPWVTWAVNEEGYTFSGHYATTLEDAVEDFRLRSRIEAGRIARKSTAILGY